MPRRREKEPTLGKDMPKTVRSADLAKADLTMMWAPFCAKRKLNPAAYTKELATFLNVRSSTTPLPSFSCGVQGSSRSRAVPPLASCRSHGIHSAQGGGGATYWAARVPSDSVPCATDPHAGGGGERMYRLLTNRSCEAALVTPM
jgi:hypothetical protein